MKKLLFLLAFALMLTLCACQKEAPQAAANTVELPPVAQATPPSAQLDIASFTDLGEYNGGDVQKLASLPSGALYMVYGADGFDSTGIFFQSANGVQLVGECGGRWSFEPVEGTLDCVTSLYVANFDYNGLEAVDKYANVIFQFNTATQRFAPYLTKSCSNVLIEEDYQGAKVAWVFWSDDANVDPVHYLIPFNLDTGEKLGRYAAQYKEPLITVMEQGAYLVSDIAFDSQRAAIRIMRSVIDAQGNVLQDETFYCNTETGEFSH